MSECTNIWRYDPVTGYWRLVRNVLKARAQDWLRIWREDEPSVVFKLSQYRPHKAPQ